MSECVVRMKLPKNCYECEMRGAWAFCPIRKWPVVGYKKERHEDCPIVCALPKNHGTLIDLETAAEGLSERFNSCHMTCGAVMQFLDGLPTLVPAERSET